MPKVTGHSHTGGRSKASEWSDVNMVADPANKVECKYCGALIIKKIERIAAHMLKCKKKVTQVGRDANTVIPVTVVDLTERSERSVRLRSVSPSTSRAKLPQHNESMDISMPKSDSVVSTVSSSSFLSFKSNDDVTLSLEDFEEKTDQSTSNIGTPTPSLSTSTPMKEKGSHNQKQKQISITPYMVRTTAKQKESFDLGIAKFFFSSNVSFNAIENKHFINVIQELRPGYTPPDRKKLGNQLLNKINEEVIETMKIELMEDSCITLIQDGWSNISNDPIIAHSIHNGHKPYLISSVDAGSEKKSALYCSQLAIDAINEIKEKYDKDVSSY